MKINTNFAKKMVADILRQSQATPTDRRIMHPTRDWFIGLGVAVVAIGGGSYYATVIYQEYNNLDSSPPASPNTNLVYREIEVASALEYLKERNDRHLESFSQVNVPSSAGETLSTTTSPNTNPLPDPSQSNPLPPTDNIEPPTPETPPEQSAPDSPLDATTTPTLESF